MSAEAKSTWWLCPCGYESVYAKQDRERKRTATRRRAVARSVSEEEPS